jgi:acetylglutamate kinase
MQNPIVIKIGGNEIDDPYFLLQLAPTIKSLSMPTVIVHGGGREISNLQKVMGIEPRYLDGVRITDEPSMTIVEMVLCGSVNKRLVRRLLGEGIDALGLSGVDRGLVRAEKMPHPTVDMEFTGEVKSVRGDILLDWLKQGITPVIAPVSLGSDQRTYNVNADHVAGAVAQAIGADKIVFLTNVEGVLINKEVAKTLTRETAVDLVADGTIFGGMIPKVQTALAALDSGIPQAVITNLTGLKTHGGTVFTRSNPQKENKED